MAFLKLDPDSYRQNALIISLRLVLLPIIGCISFIGTLLLTGGGPNSALSGLVAMATAYFLFISAVCIFPCLIIVFPIKDPAISNRVSYFILALICILCALFSLTMLPQGTTYYDNNSGGSHYPAGFSLFYLVYVASSFYIFAALADRKNYLFLQLAGVMLINCVVFFITSHIAVNLDIYGTNFSALADINVDLSPAKAVCLFATCSILVPVLIFWSCRFFIRKISKLSSKSIHPLFVIIGFYVLAILVSILGLSLFNSQYYVFHAREIISLILLNLLPYLVLTLQLGLSVLCRPFYIKFSPKTNKIISVIALLSAVILLTVISVDQYERRQSRKAEREAILNRHVGLVEHKQSVKDLLANNGSFSNIKIEALGTEEKQKIQRELRHRFSYLDEPSSMKFGPMLRVTADYIHNPDNMSLSDKIYIKRLCKELSVQKCDEFEQKAVEIFNDNGPYQLDMVCVIPPADASNNFLWHLDKNFEGLYKISSDEAQPEYFCLNQQLSQIKEDKKVNLRDYQTGILKEIEKKESYLLKLPYSLLLIEDKIKPNINMSYYARIGKPSLCRTDMKPDSPVVEFKLTGYKLDYLQNEITLEGCLSVHLFASYTCSPQNGFLVKPDLKSLNKTLHNENVTITINTEKNTINFISPLNSYWWLSGIKSLLSTSYEKPRDPMVDAVFFYNSAFAQKLEQNYGIRLEPPSEKDYPNY